MSEPLANTAQAFAFSLIKRSTPRERAHALRMCLILAIVEMVFIPPPSRRSIYGDQGQEVSREVQERFVAKRGQEQNEEQKVGQREVGVIAWSVRSLAQRGVQSIWIVWAERLEWRPEVDETPFDRVVFFP